MAIVAWERGRAGSPRGQPAWGARLVRTEREARTELPRGLKKEHGGRTGPRAPSGLKLS